MHARSARGEGVGFRWVERIREDSLLTVSFLPILPFVVVVPAVGTTENVAKQKDLMSRTIAHHVRFKNMYIS